MPAAATPRRVVVMGADGAAVGREVARRRADGQRVAGFAGRDEALAATMAEELLGGLDEVVVVDG